MYVYSVNVCQPPSSPSLELLSLCTCTCTCTCTCRMGMAGARKPAYSVGPSGPISQPLVGSGPPSQPLGGGGGPPGSVQPQTQTAPLVSDLHVISRAGFNKGRGLLSVSPLVLQMQPQSMPCPPPPRANSAFKIPPPPSLALPDYWQC